ncbi:hypothetical protein GCM10009716_44890 [Streptomyces sodiiphilus]|uniref:DUF397 domain-containing protein n=1 Tax=Streptomyces sodiiphilus TaxID=226217 RepID=A0ABN2PVK7_9ACTN
MSVGALTWQKSSYSVDASACLELASVPDGPVLLRESESPALVLVTSQDRLRGLLALASAGPRLA